MDSFFARNRLSAYLDRTLPRAEAEAVAEAIARDIALSSDVQAMHKVLGMMHEAGRVPAPTGFHARTVATIASKPVPGSQVAWLQRRLSRIPTEVVALVGAALIAAVAWQRTASQETTDDAPAPAAEAPVAPPSDDEVGVDSPEVPVTTEQNATPQEPPSPKQARSPTPPPPARTVTPVPESLPYDPDAPLAYRILSGGDQVLYDIATLADESNGRLVDAYGKLFTPHSLNEGNSFASVYLVVNEDNAPSTHARLLKRSGMEPYPLEGPQPPLNDGETVFMIEAQL